MLESFKRCGEDNIADKLERESLDENLDHENKLSPDKKEEVDDNRFDFCFHEKSTKNNPDILSKEDREMRKKFVIEHRMDIEEELLKYPETEREIEKIKERIIQLGKNLGLDLEDRFIGNKDIHILSDEIYEKEFEGCGGHGNSSANEIFLRKDENFEKRIFHCIQHELIHIVSKQKVITLRDVAHINTIGYANTKNKNFEFFNEGLTELTNQQLNLENGSCASYTAYIEEVIFITELIKDISHRTDKPYKDILAQFQIGMFEGKRGHLKIISDNYGGEAIKALSKMKDNRDDIVDIAEIFGLKEAIRRINDYENMIKTNIDIGDKSYNIQKQQ